MAKERRRKPKWSIRNRLPRSRAFKRYEQVKKARFDGAELRDNIEVMLKLAWVVFLYGFFIIAPMRIAAIYGPGWGVLVALLGFPIWGALGIAPRPGGCFSFSEWFLYKAGYTMILLSVVGATLKLLIPLIRH